MAALTCRVVCALGGGMTQGQGTTRYYAIGGNAETGYSTARANSEWKSRSSYTIGNLFINMRYNGISNSSTLKVVKNGTPGNPQLTITANTTGIFEDISNTINIVTTDLVCYEIVVGGTKHTDIGDFGFGALSVTLANSSNIYPLIWNNTGASTGTIGLSYYFGLGAQVAEQNTISEAYSKFKTSATLNYLRTYIGTNPNATSCTITTYKNGSGTSLALTITGSTTGEFEDNSNSISCVSGDLVCHYFAYAGSGLMKINNITLQCTSDSKLMISGGTQATTPSNYTALEGRLWANVSQAESFSQVTSRIAATAGRLGVNCTAYIGNGTVTLRKNGADTALTVAITGTGWAEDVSDTVSVSATDELGYYITLGNSTIESIQMEFPYTAPAGPANIKTKEGLTFASVKTIEGLEVGSIKTLEGLN